MKTPDPLQRYLGTIDDLRARHLRWLEEAARIGESTVLLWTDETRCLWGYRGTYQRAMALVMREPI